MGQPTPKLSQRSMVSQHGDVCVRPGNSSLGASIVSSIVLIAAVCRVISAGQRRSLTAPIPYEVVVRSRLRRLASSSPRRRVRGNRKWQSRLTVFTIRGRVGRA